jgi:hypothetical protein
MKGFDFKKIIPRKALAFLGLGVVLWLAVCFLAEPSAVFASAGRGLKAFGAVMVLSAAALAFRATAWKIALDRKETSLIAVLTAAMGLGGTPIQLALLKKKTGIADGAGSVVADQAVRSLAAMIFVGFGLFLGFLFVPGNALVRGLMLVAAVAGFGFVVISVKRRRGFFTAILGGLPVRLVSPAVRGRFEERDRFLRRFRSERSGSFFMSLLIHLVVFGLGALEILAVGRAIDAYFPGALALALAALIPAARLAFSFIPAAFGVLEGVVALILSLNFGAPLAPVGVAIVCALRLRTLVWWAVGFATAGNPAKILFAR